MIIFLILKLKILIKNFIMIEILTMLIPSILIIIALVMFLDLYILIRKYLKLKIEKLKKDN
jgi:hypothetical protein